MKNTANLKCIFTEAICKMLNGVNNMKQLLLAFCSLALSVAVHAQLLTSSDLPIIVINTNGQTIVDDPKIMADMGIIYNGDGLRNRITDPYNHYNGKVGIEIRGQSSQMFPMKSYSFELWNSSGSSVNRSLFGLPAESDWVLYAPYTDKTLMHNILAYTMSLSLGHWASHCRFVEVVVNGDYKGIYVLMEKIKRNAGRVNVNKLGSGDISGDAVTGGYIFSIDKEPNGWFSNYNAGNGRIQYSYVYPKVTSVVQAQRDYIYNYTDSFESALAGIQFQDKQNGWRRFADELSFIDYFIVNEISRNVDGYRLSTYLNKDRNSLGGKIQAGPVWDYDLAFRNANYCDGYKEDGWAWQFNSVCPGDYFQVPFWWAQFTRDTAFRNRLNCRWKEVRQGVLSNGRMNQLIDSLVSATTEARQRHFSRWPVLGQYIWPNPDPIPTTYPDEITALKNWLNNRLSWLDAHIPDVGGCASYPANAAGTALLQVYPNPFGTQLNLTIPSKLNQAVQTTIYTASGALVYRGTLQCHAGYNYFMIPSSGWAHGIYWLRVETADGTVFKQRVLHGF